MKTLNIIMEASLSQVALTSGPEATLVPHILWGLIGDLPPDRDDDDGFDFRPLQEEDNEGNWVLNDKYMLGSLAYDYFKQLVSEYESFEIGSYDDGVTCFEYAKILHDVSINLGHRVLLFNTCDY